MLVLLADFVDARVAQNDDGRCLMDLDVDQRVFPESVIFAHRKRRAVDFVRCEVRGHVCSPGVNHVALVVGVVNVGPVSSKLFQRRVQLTRPVS